MTAGMARLDETYAITLYEDATAIDDFPGTYPPTDTGSSGLAVAKVLKKRGVIVGYTHGFSTAALASALQSGPCMVGLAWFNSMFEPHSDGGVPMDQASGEAGGHELCFDALDVIDGGDHDRYWFTNSWGTSWGAHGRGYLTGRDMAAQLSRALQADVVVPVIGAPPPPAPVPTPTAAERTLYQAAQALSGAVRAWADQVGLAPAANVGRPRAQSWIPPQDRPGR